MKKTLPTAFTLVELLVVICIIGILIGMAFPAVNAARESSRRALCQNRLSRLGAALGDYEAAHGNFPPGTTDAKGPIHSVPTGNHINWAVQLLPYLDEVATFKHVDLAAGTYDPKNAPVRNLHIAAFICPSDRSDRREDVVLGSYAGCHNEVEAPIDADNHGVLFLNSHVTVRDVSDGLSHTIFLGEKRSAADDLGWMSGTRATLRNTGAPINDRPAAKPAGELAVGGFGSFHPGGAGFLFGDGASRFVSDEIDQGVFEQLGHRADGKLLQGGPTRETPGAE
jgi:prepilin-type N-terminal cleavage/methylation domain-containing protein